MSKNVGLLVRLKAKAGKEQEVHDFLKSALPMAQGETQTTTWYAIRISESEFGIFDTFPNNDGRQAHINGEIAKALFKHAPDLLAEDPKIEPVEVLAAK